MKQRITSLDIKVIALELYTSIVGCRLQNIYNLLNSERVFSLKFSKPDYKKNLLVDYGSKLYLSEFDRRLEPTPSNFVTKLRKHLKSKRLTNLKQLGNDRIIVMEFSNGLYYLVLEFFSAGNVLLLNSNQEILSLQRVVHEKENISKYAVHEKYLAFDSSVLFADSVKYYNDDKETGENDTVDDSKPVNKVVYESKEYKKEDIIDWLVQAETKSTVNSVNESKFHQSKKKKESKVLSILKLLFLNASYLSSDLLQKNLVSVGIDPTQSCKVLENNIEAADKIVEVLNKSEKDIVQLLNSGEEITGYILLKKNPLYDPSEEQESALLGDSEKLSTEYTFESFHPFMPYIKDEDIESQKIKVLDIKGYNKTLDKFFSSLDLLKNALKIQQSKKLLDKKLSSVKEENLAKIGKLSDLEASNYRKAELIILNADKIEQCKSAVQSLIDQGMDWKNIETLIKSEQDKGSEFAKMISLPLNLKENKIKVRLVDSDTQQQDSEQFAESDSDSLSDLSLDSDEEQEENSKERPKKNNVVDIKYVTVVIELNKSAYANSKTYFDQKKTAQIKKEKTEKTAEIALKNSEKKINATLKKDIERSNKDLSIRKARQKNWFEKFYWFISSEGYLVIAPKDKLQLEMIYYKYFNSKNDYYVTSDVDGSLQTFVKNPYKHQEIPPSTLNQAGTFALSASKAWSAKSITSAWYVEGSKLTKKDINDGSLLPDGVLNITGEKTFLPPAQLTMGLGLVWIVNDETKEAQRERRLKKQQELAFEPVTEIADVKSVVKEKISKLNNKLQNLSIEGEENAIEDTIDESATKEDANEDEGGTNENVNIEREDEQHAEVNQSPETELISSKASIKSISSKIHQKKTRGKKAKQKRLNKKYADQDEEDRLMRLKALGVLKQVEANQEAKQKSEVDNLKNGKFENNKKPSAFKQQKKYNEQFMDILEEEVTDADYLAIFDSFSFRINSLDEKIVDVIPMFAPWQALSKLKYKAKIQAGNGKIGKSMNEVLNYFVNRKSNKETSLVRKFEEKENGSENKNEKSLDSFFDFDLDFDAEHNIINQLKPLDLQPAFTAKGLRVVLPSSAGKTKGNTNGKGNSKAGKRR